MHGQASRFRILLFGVALALFAGFMPASSIDTEVGAGSSFAIERDATSPTSDLMLSEVGIDLSDDFGLALEDSVELFRIDIPCRIRGRDDVATQSNVLLKVVLDRHAETSPPLLV